MSAAQSSSSALFGNQECTGVSRALGELQARRPVQINAPGETLLILPVEGLDNQRLTEFVIPDLIITQQRALALGLDASTPMAAWLGRFIVFRDATGTDQVAIIVGKPDFAQSVLVRLHSACLTGGVFGSRRCDCGDQLALALTREELGCGVILYLAQEGRGFRLANKMRAYRLQDAGLDTFDANTTLGFNDNERDYGICRAHASDAELLTDSVVHQQCSQARWSNAGGDRDRSPHPTGDLDQSLQQALSDYKSSASRAPAFQLEDPGR
jgi:GTP cyclohydrolase II